MRLSAVECEISGLRVVIYAEEDHEFGFLLLNTSFARGETLRYTSPRESHSITIDREWCYYHSFDRKSVRASFGMLARVAEAMMQMDAWLRYGPNNSCFDVAELDSVSWYAVTPDMFPRRD
jgi:hypothetical protein